MKGFFGFILAILVVYSIYYDLQYGTIPNMTKAATVNSHAKFSKKSHSNNHIAIPYQKATVQPGDTVLSIVEKINGQQTASIQKVVHDFEILNPGVNANKVKIGHHYMFPVYNAKQ